MNKCTRTHVACRQRQPPGVHFTPPLPPTPNPSGNPEAQLSCYISRISLPGVPVWPRGLRIHHCPCCGMGSNPGLGIFVCYGGSQKKNNNNNPPSSPPLLPCRSNPSLWLTQTATPPPAGAPAPALAHLSVATQTTATLRGPHSILCKFLTGTSKLQATCLVPLLHSLASALTALP